MINKEKVLINGENTRATPQQKNNTKPQYLWASLARILATLMIFMYHFGGMTGEYSIKNLDTIAIIIFLFISGFFGYQEAKVEISWLKRRFVQILIPYWPVIFFALLMNRLADYKETNWFQDVGTFFGLGLFFSEPVYVLSWFVTLILVLYMSVYGFQLINYVGFKVLWFIGGFIISLFILKVHYLYFPAFYLGYFFHSRGWLNNEKYTNTWPMLRRANLILFNQQRYCYSFFLIHGGCLVLFITFLKLPPINAFIASFSSTIFLTILYKNCLTGILGKFGEMFHAWERPMWEMKKLA